MSISLSDYLSPYTSILVSLAHAQEVGRKLGRFFAGLHSPTTFDLVRDSNEGRRIDANVSGGRDVVKSMVIDRIGGMLARTDIPAADANSLASMVKRAWDDSEQSPNTAFTLGDAWTGSILIRNHLGEAQVAVIDWEFASFVSSGIITDIAMLTAHLKLRTIAARAVGSEEIAYASEIVAQEMSKSYHRFSVDELTPWTNYLLGSEEWALLAKNICISIGRDMVHNACDGKWPCNCCEMTTQKDRCELRRVMVAKGVEFLSAAATSTVPELFDFASRDDVLRYLICTRVDG